MKYKPIGQTIRELESIRKRIIELELKAKDLEDNLSNNPKYKREVLK